MTEKSNSYLLRLKAKYKSYGDQDSLSALAEVEKQSDRARELRIYREQPKTLEIIDVALKRYRTCVEKLTNPATAVSMTDFDRAYCFASMDWAKYILDVVGEDPERADRTVDDIIESYAKKAGVA